MQVTSLGFRTDLALLALGGSQLRDGGAHLIATSPHNPLHWWGNFLLLPAPPSDGEVDGWLERFAAEVPEASHVAFGIDGTSGTVDQLAAFARRGMETEAAAVMTATSVNPPPLPNTAATYRLLSSDDDWAQSVRLRVRCEEDGLEPQEQQRYAAARVASNRQLGQVGHGGWFGAFLDGELVSQLGLYTASPGVARYQTVETAPEFRRRGLCGTLVHHVGTYGFERLQARTLVMVADPHDAAINVYRSVGFQEAETQLMALRRPSSSALHYSASIVVDASPETLYDMVSDVTRMGEWSPVCRACWWDEGAGPRVGSWFTGRNETPQRTWETRSEVVAADPGRQFSFVVGGSWIRWSYTFAPAGGGTTVTESWDFLPAGIARFRERFGAEADAQIADRSAAARAGIPATLAAINAAAETSAGQE